MKTAYQITPDTFEFTRLSTPVSGSALRSLTTFLDLQVKAYEYRLALQPNGQDALEHFNKIRDLPIQRQLQDQMGKGLLSDWQSLGKDTLILLRLFGQKLLENQIEVPSEVTSGYLHGFQIADKPGQILALHPTLVTALNHIHRARWKTEKEELQLALNSLSLESVQKLEPLATEKQHLGPLEEIIPILSNCDRIGVMVQTRILAQISDSDFNRIVLAAVPGNPMNLPLKMWSAETSTPPITTVIS
jgi:hypothetical protein